jgi:hypothetical protein
MSVRQADDVAARLRSWGLPWNVDFRGGPADVSSGPVATGLPGGIKLTLLSPGDRELARLAEHWQRERRKSSTQNQDVEPDDDSQAGSGGLGTASRRVYIAAASADRQWVSRLKDALSSFLPLEEFVIDEVVFEQDVEPGESFTDWRQQAADRAGAVFALVTQAAIESRFMQSELRSLLEATKERQLRFVWILVDRCDWSSTPLQGIRPANDPDRPLASLSPNEAGKELEQIAERVARTMLPASANASTGRASRPPRDADDGPPDVNRLVGRPYAPDRSVANNASLAFLAEHGGKSVLIGGDASAEVLTSSIRQLLTGQGARRLRVDAFVVPHNGSAGNVNRELLELLECDRYLISTNGAMFRHPDRETIARILAYGRSTRSTPLTLVFNYRTPWTAVWDDPGLKSRWNYQTVYPTGNDGGIKVQI